MEHTEMHREQSVHEEIKREEGRIRSIHVQMFTYSTVYMYVGAVYLRIHGCGIVHRFDQLLHHSLFLLPCSDIGLCLSSHFLLSVLALFSLLPCCLWLLIQAQLQYKHTYTSTHTHNNTHNLCTLDGLVCRHHTEPYTPNQPPLCRNGILVLPYMPTSILQYKGRVEKWARIPYHHRLHTITLIA